MSVPSADGEARSSGYGSRDRVDCLRRPGAVVVSHVGVHDPPEMRDGEKEEVVEGFLPQGPHEPFDMGGRVRRAVRDGDALETHHLMKPAIEMAAVAPGSAIPFDPADRRPVLAVDRVVVVDQEARRGSCRGGRTDLLLHPGQRRVVVTFAWTMRREAISMMTKT